MSERSQRKGVGMDKLGSMAKALDIMETVVSMKRPCSVSELAELLDLPKPTAHRIVAALRAADYLRRDPVGSGVTEGGRLVSFALDVMTAASRRGPRHSILEAVAEETGETCNLGVMSSGQVVYLDRVETKWPLGLRFEPGSRVPIHCTALGKLFLSGMSRQQRGKYLATLPMTRYTDNTITGQQALEMELDRIRELGYSIDNQEFISGVVCVAVPIIGPRGRLSAGLAFSAPQARLALDDARRYVPYLRSAAEKLAITFQEDD